MEHLGGVHGDWNGSDPLYLTLCGAEGLDIQAAIDAGIIQLNEVKGIAASDLGKCVAVERVPDAVLKLQARHPGLRILEQDIQGILGGANPLAWPEQRERRSVCRSKVVNLDFNGAFKAIQENQQIQFPIAVWIQKLARMHDVGEPINWSVYLTLNASLAAWSNQVWGHVLKVLSENMASHPGFGDDLRALFGPDRAARIEDRTCVRTSLEAREEQGLLMAFAPKAICQDIPDGWTMTVHKNVRYGGETGVAPMVSQIIDFHKDPALIGLRDQSYQRSVASILSDTWAIGIDGGLESASGRSAG